jgi:hypothetical protein
MCLQPAGLTFREHTKVEEYTVNRGPALPLRLHRPLAVLAVLTGVLAVVLLPAMALDDRQLFGVSVWLKPWKFAVSIAIYSLTVAWMVTLIHTGARLARAAATGAAVALGIEIALITTQAARGVPSHFNNQTALDSMLFNVMGASIILVWLATGVLALLLVRQRPDDRVLAAGLRWGLAVSLLGMILAVLMINPVNQWMLRTWPSPADRARRRPYRGRARRRPGRADRQLEPCRR